MLEPLSKRDRIALESRHEERTWLWDTPLAGLTRTAAWLADVRRGGVDDTPWDRGEHLLRATIRSEQPLVSLVLKTDRGGIAWGKQRFYTDAPLAVPWAITRYTKPSGQVSHWVHGHLNREGGLLYPGQQVMLHPLPAPETLHTGGLFPLLSASEPLRWTCGLLLLARADVVIGRCHIWRVRPRIAALLPQPFREMLSHQRTGQRTWQQIDALGA